MTVALIMRKLRAAGQKIKERLTDEQGIGVVEVILILVVLIGLVIVFKGQINKLLEDIFKQINSQSKEVY